MKKAILTFGLFSMVMVLTSFTTPGPKTDNTEQHTHAAVITVQNNVILPQLLELKLDNEPGGTVSPTRPTKKLDFEPGTVSPTRPTKKLD